MKIAKRYMDNMGKEDLKGLVQISMLSFQTRFHGLITAQIEINPRRGLITIWAVFNPFHTHLLTR